MTRTASARHRSAARATTPLTAIGTAVSGPAGRRAALAVASSGIVLTLTASASVAGSGADVSARTPVPLANFTSVADDAVGTSPTVTVAADATWSFSTAEVSSEAPPPPPPPPPVVERPSYASTSDDDSSSDAAASRSEERTTYADVPATASGSAIIDIARRYVGTPYVSGGASPGGFDCSGFTQYVFAQVGVTLPRTSGAQRNAGYVVSAAEARPGDLVWAPGHVGIYTGNGMHIAARSPGTPLYESEIYMSNPVFIRVL